ncbi:MAG TPA: amidohydrolase family protein, partial [Kofleriaceae bacterium]|nr:amidohydrolase family protein [Kofleriaceae bacterium]
LVARELAAARVPVILDPMDNLPGSFDTLQVRDDNARLLAEAGVLIALSTLGDGPNARNLRQRAGDAIANGLPREAALAAVTSNPGQIFGMRGQGTIARGQLADLVVWSGDPFEHSTRVEHVFIGGARQSLVTRQKRLLERYRTLSTRR